MKIFFKVKPPQLVPTVHPFVADQLVTRQQLARASMGQNANAPMTQAELDELLEKAAAVNSVTLLNRPDKA